MCLITLDSMLTADKDIVCYKILRLNLDGEYTSYYYPGHKWKLNELYTTDLEEKPWGGIKQIELGFHSYKNFKEAETLFKSQDPNAVLVKCIIPQKSSYYSGSQYLREGYTSSAIKITEVISHKGKPIEPDNYPYKKEDVLKIEYMNNRTICVTVLGIYEYQGGYQLYTTQGFLPTDKEGNNPHFSIQNVRDLKTKGE